jgi:hypothetical protein
MALEAGGGGEGTKARRHADHHEGGVEAVEAGSGDEHRGHGGDAREGSDLGGWGAEPDGDPGEQVTVVAPATSSLAVLRAGRSVASNTAASPMSSTPTGTLMKNTQRQPGPSVSRPLAITPTDAEVPPTAPKIPRARLRSWPSGKVTASIDRAVVPPGRRRTPGSLGR